MSFEKLEIISSIKKALAAEGYEIPTPIQKQAIPVILEGRDILGSAQTGTGKTAAFAVPILQMLSAEKDHTQLSFPIQALILSPTRELALQIKESFSTYGRFTGLTSAVVFGGVPQKPQTDKLKKGVDILVATPGRLLDLLEQRVVNLSKVKIFVLDEADRMMDMGFIHDIKKVIKVLPEKRQNLLFSATLAPEIAKLASSFLHEPVTIDIEPESPTVDAITQGVYFVAKPDKKRLLVHLLKENDADSVIVFTRTKYGADNLSRYLKEAGIVSSAIHSDKEQNARQRALQNFKSKKIRVLVATDIAARGLDIEQLAMVVNYDIPNIPDSYIHRIGRTGRAGLSGLALSFCDVEERAYLKDINKLLKTPIPEMSGYPFAQIRSADEKFERPVERRQQGNRPNQGAQKKFTGNRPQGRNQNDQHQQHKRTTGQTGTPEDKNKEKGTAEIPHYIKHKRGDGYPRYENSKKPFVNKTGDNQNKTEQHPNSPKSQTEQSGKSHSTGTGSTKHRSQAWRNDPSASDRYQKRSGDSHFKRDDNKKHNTAHPRGNSTEQKPGQNKSTTSSEGTPKSEKLPWFKRLGFNKKKKGNGGKS
jgi:ATP-dependent RNA helicase RhlE